MYIYIHVYGITYTAYVYVTVYVNVYINVYVNVYRRGSWGLKVEGAIKRRGDSISSYFLQHVSPHPWKPHVGSSTAQARLKHNDEDIPPYVPWFIFLF